MINRISVVIPTYNAAAYLADTLNSILTQLSVIQDEIIVVDDNSKDETCELVMRYAALSDIPISLYRMPVNSGGPARPRNIGIQMARGAYIALCDADDIWHPQKIEVQLASAAFFDVLCSEKINFTNQAELNIRSFDFSSIQLKKINKKSFFFGNPVVNSSVFCSRTIFEKFSFMELRQYIAIEDYDLWIRLMMSGKSFGKIEYPLIYYRKSMNQISYSKINMVKKNFNMYSGHFGYAAAFLMVSMYGFRHGIRILFNFFRSSLNSK